MQRYGVLGGGIAGLTAALRLTAAGRPATVYEKEPLPGGLAAGFRVGDAWLEKFYHHLFGTDRAIIGLINELGLAGRLLWPKPVTAVLTGGREYPLNSAGAVLRFRPLPVADRLRMGAAIAALKAMPAPALLEGQTASHWLRRWMGQAAYETVWRPQQESKFGARADDIAAPWFWARIHDRTPQLGYIRGGFQLLYEALADRVRANGGMIHFGTAVEAVRTRPTGELVVETDQGVETFDRVISTLPPRLTCRLVPELPADYRARYDRGDAYGAHCLILALDRQLTDSYWLSVLDPGFPFMALVEHTNYMPAEDYGGRRLIYLGNYRAMDDPIYRKTPDDLITEYEPWIRRINPAFSRDWITESWAFSAAYAQPIVDLQYRHHIPPAETPVPGLFLATMFQVYPHDRGQNYSVVLADQLARRLLTQD